MRTCSRCNETKELNVDNFPIRSNKNNIINFRAECRECYNRLRRLSPKYAQRKTIQAAKDRAKVKGIDFNLRLRDVKFPEFCPVLGVKLERGKKNWETSPSLDRIDNSKGYTVDNVIVVSALVNSIKSAACWQQIIRVGKFYRNLERKKTNEQSIQR